MEAMLDKVLLYLVIYGPPAALMVGVTIGLFGPRRLVTSRARV
ncbi:MAG: hypothetical protein ACLFV8_00380 [Alphaproteobacteria bacterium]